MQYTRFTQLMLLLALFSGFINAARLDRRADGEEKREAQYGYGGYGEGNSPGSGHENGDGPTTTHTVYKTIHETIKVKTTKTFYTTVKSTDKVYITVTRTTTDAVLGTTTITAPGSTITDFVDVTATITEAPETETVTVTDEAPCLSY